jgi:hypothetical protein
MANNELNTPVAEQEKHYELVGVVDLGPGNTGTLSVGHFTESQKEELFNDCTRPEYWKKATGRFRCIDGRVPEGGLAGPESDEADPQGPGGEPVFQTAIDFMTEENPTETLSFKVAKNTKNSISQDRHPVVHGDDHKGKAGCKANAAMRDGLRENGKNIGVVVPKVWAVSKLRGLDEYITEEDIYSIIRIGAANAENDALWDATPEQVADIAVANGAEYEELIEEHREGLAILALSEDEAFDEVGFMEDHLDADGKPIEAFVESVGVYEKTAFKDAASSGKSKRHAALRTAGFVANGVGIAKTVSIEEQGGGEALQAVIVR